MTKQLKPLAIAAALALAGIASAADFAHPSPTESGTEYHGAEYRSVEGKLARVDSWKRGTEEARAQSRPVDDFEYSAGDGGWNLRQHRYEFVEGRFVHADEADHPLPGRGSGQ